MVYEALIKSHLSYGIILWGNNTSGSMNRLIKLQKKSIRLIEVGKVHTEPILKKYGLLKVKDEYIKAIKILAWQLIRNIAPNSIKKEFNWINNDMRLVRRQRRVIVTRFVNNRLNNQAIGEIERWLNKTTVDQVNYKIGKFKRETKKKLVQKYRDTIICNNEGCSECTV